MTPVRVVAGGERWIWARLACSSKLERHEYVAASME
jgi:hypothetical protein